MSNDSVPFVSDAMTYQQLSDQPDERDTVMENHGLKSESSTVSVSETMWDGELMMEGGREMESRNLKWGVQRKRRKD